MQTMFWLAGFFPPSQLLDHAYHVFASHFFLVWAFFLLLIVVCGLWCSGYRESLWSTSSSEGSAEPAGNRQFSATDGVSAVLLVAFLVGYLFLIFYKEDFAYYDDDMLTDFSLQGKNFPAPIWPGTGRFYPLADQEFNLLKFVTRTPVGYHALVAAQFVVFVVILFFALREFRVRYRALIVLLAVVAPSFVIPFTGFVYPERNLVFWLVILVLCLRGYDKTEAPIYFVGCLVATHFALYYKETAVLFVVAYAVTRLALEFRAQPLAGRRSWRAMAKEDSLSLGMLAVSGIYVGLFLIAMSPHRNFSYIAEHRETLASVLFSSLQLDWLLWILLVVLLFRAGRSVLSSSRLDPMWDALGVGALAYFFGILALKLNSGYYNAPADFIALLYLASMSLVWLSKPSRGRIAVVAVLFVLILLHNVAYSTFRMVDRKNIIAMKSQLAEFLRGYQATATGDAVEVFFPFSGGYHLMGLSSYLKYQGFQLAGESGGRNMGPRLVVEGREKFVDDRCVSYRDYPCIHADSAPAGALIVVLPDDDVSMKQVEEIGKGSALLFSTNACAPCSRTGSWFRLLHAISPDYSDRELPEHWLQLQVFKKPA